MAKTLRKSRIIDTYATLLENAQGGAETFFKEVEQYLITAKIPNVSFERTQVKTHFLGGAGREHIIVTHRNLPEFKMYIGARDYGNYLAVTWAERIEVGFMSSQLSKQIAGSGVGLTYANLDVFSEQELSAYTTIVHRAVVDTAEKIMAGLNQDFSKMNTRSRSGLAAW
jgi:hypothetical protein